MPYGQGDHGSLHVLTQSMANLLKTNILQGQKTGEGSPPQQTPAIPHNIVATPPIAPNAKRTRKDNLIFQANYPQRPGLMENAIEIPPHPNPRRRVSESDSEHSLRQHSLNSDYKSDSPWSDKKSISSSKMKTPMYGNDMQTQTGLGFHLNDKSHHLHQMNAFDSGIPGSGVKEKREYINNNPGILDAFRQYQIKQDLKPHEHGNHEKVLMGRADRFQSATK